MAKFRGTFQPPTITMLRAFLADALKRYSTTEVAELSGLSPSTVREFAKGGTQPARQTELRVRDIFYMLSHHYPPVGEPLAGLHAAIGRFLQGCSELPCPDGSTARIVSVDAPEEEDNDSTFVVVAERDGQRVDLRVLVF